MPNFMLHRTERSRCSHPSGKRGRKAVQNHFLLNPQIPVGWPKESRRLSKALNWVGFKRFDVLHLAGASSAAIAYK
jgi:hypothetical protein